MYTLGDQSAPHLQRSSWAGYPKRKPAGYALALLVIGVISYLIGSAPAARSTFQSPVSTDTPTPTELLTPLDTSTPDLSPTPSPTPLPLDTPSPTATTAGVVYRRALQVWPDRSVGLASGPLGNTQGVPLPIGVYNTADGQVVRARTYLHFPLDVFPPGTEVMRATLYVYVDGGAGGGSTKLGVYRALEPWGAGDWGDDPAHWPTLLVSPIAITTVGLGESPAPPPGALPTPTPLPTAAAESPLPTPTPSAIESTIPLQQMPVTWLTWDITALARAWLKREVPDNGLALAVAPHPDADLQTAGNLLVARWFAADDPTTRPYLIAEIVVHPVTPTPLPTPIVLLPRAGGSAGWINAVLLLGGAVVLMLALAVRSGRQA